LTTQGSARSTGKRPSGSADDPADRNGRARWRRWRPVAVFVLAALLLAYAIDVTDINLEEPLEPRRQENLAALLRELAHPDLFSFRDETRTTTISLRMPCPDEVRGSLVSFQGRELLLSPNCADSTQDFLTLQGQGFGSSVEAAVIWRPSGTNTVRSLTRFRTDEAGGFAIQFTMPDLRPSEEPHQIEVTELLSRQITGASPTAAATLRSIVETILMALMASTLGTILAVPISFLAARNIMAGVGLPVASLMGALLAAMAAGAAGLVLARMAGAVLAPLAETPWLGALLLLAAAGVTWLLVRSAFQSGSSRDGPAESALAGWPRLLLGLLAAFAVLALGSALLTRLGGWMEVSLGPFGFLGNFVKVVFELIPLTLPAGVGLLAAFLAGSAASHRIQEGLLRGGGGRMQAAVLTFLAVTATLVLLVWAANWICLLGLCRALPQEVGALAAVVLPAAGLVGLVAAVLAARADPRSLFPLGTIVYSISRTILNGLRAIEPVIMGFVIVSWVGLGPFAGIIALMLHSVADLGKLFSEQVENISAGPVEAITATGANKLQAVVYSVIPQVVPHYIAFIFYRWDINVRLSTIIGFVGGGGIGFILFRSANLLQYRQASVMVIAIAIVVTVLDYVSSRVRQRII
jgi:phosphonate ABC transporter permease subunit PhnE